MNSKLFINNNSSVLKAFKLMQQNRIKTLCVINNKKEFLGTISDGDIRGGILKNSSLNFSINSIYNKKSFYLKKNNFSLKNTKKFFLENKYDFIPLVNNFKKVVKIIFFKDCFAHKKKYYQNHVIIMAGGQGKRLKPYTEVIPKPLLSIKGRAMIQIVVEDFLKNGFNNFTISTGYKNKLIEAFFYDNYFGGNIDFINESKPLGTAGSLHKIKNVIKDTFFVTNADTFLKEDKFRILNFHKEQKSDLTIVAALKKFNIPYGICEVKKNNILKKLIEKPSKHILVNIGTYLCEPKILKYIKNNVACDFNQLVEKCISLKLKVKVYVIPEKNWLDLGAKSNFF